MSLIVLGLIVPGCLAGDKQASKSPLSPKNDMLFGASHSPSSECPGDSWKCASLLIAEHPSGAEGEKRRSTLRHASTSFQFVFGEGLDGQGQELREEWLVGFVGFAQL